MQKKFIPAYLLTFVNVLGFSILMPVLPFVVESYGAPKFVYGLLLSLYGLFQFIGSPYLGKLSDIKGRKPILMVSQAGTLLSWIIFIAASFLPDIPIWFMSLPLWIIAFSRILDGITGGNISVANAYVSDITSGDEKKFIFGYLGGIAGIGMIVGPGIGGLSAGTSIGYVGTLITASIISVITLISLFLFLQESLPKDKRRSKKGKVPFLGSLFITKNIRSLNPSPVIKSLLITKVFFSMLMSFYISTIALYVIDLFHFNEKELGIFMFFVGIFLSINQAFISKFFIKKLGQEKTLILGLFLTAIGILSISFMTNLFVYIAVYYILNLGISLTLPTLNSLISTHAEPTKMGETMGISESIGSLSNALFPVLAAALYSIFHEKIYWFVFLLPIFGLIVYVKNTRSISKNTLSVKK